MRKALWILTTPVVAGGLAWAVNAADDQSPLLAQAPAPKSGKIYYFSRGGKAPNAQEESAGESAADSTVETDESGVVQRYTRKRPPAGSPKAKNYYQELFGESAAAAQASAKRASRPAANKANAGLPASRAALEERAISEASPYAGDAAAREDHPAPPSDADPFQLVSGEGDGDGVRHADHREHEGARSTSILQVGRQVKAPPVNSPAGKSAATLDDEIAELFKEPAQRRVPPPPATSRAASTQARKTARPAATARKTATAPAKPARATVQTPAQRPAAESKVVAASAAEEAAVKPAIQQISTAAAAEVPMIGLHWVNRGELNVGQECKCGLIVKNTGKLAARDIVVEAHFPRTVQLRDAEPFPNDTKGHLSWVFDHIAAGEEKTIEITMVPGRRGELTPSATVRFTGVASTVLQVEEPQISLAIDGPKDVSVGESATQTIVVSNPGSGVAHDVVVHAMIPDGLEYARGKNVELWIGSLGPGDVREVRLPLSAVTGGHAMLKVEARGSNLVQRAQAEIQVAAPRLKVEIAGPGLRYVGRHAQYTLTVTNEGVAATDNVRIVHLVPEGFEFIKADRGGRYDAATTSVSWFLGRVEAGQSLQVAVDLNAKQIGEHQHHVQVSGESGSVATAKIDTKVDGSSAVVMEVRDLDDPVEVESQTAYEITIRNEGTKAAQNLRLACELPQGVELLDTDGPSEHVVEKGMLLFRPVADLAAGAKISYLVKVQGKMAGNLRLRAKLTSNSSAEPLIVEELTKFYAD